MPVPKGVPKMERISAKQRALEQIQRWIIEGTLRPGEKILDCELAEALGVSRTPSGKRCRSWKCRGSSRCIPDRRRG